MKREILEALAQKWEMKAKPPEKQDGSKESEIPNAEAAGERQGYSLCAKELRMLVSLIED